MNYIFSLAGLTYLVKVPVKLNISERHKDFLWVEDTAIRQYNGTIDIICSDDLPMIPGDAVKEQYRFYSPSVDNRSWFINSPDGIPYAFSDRSNAHEYISIQILPSALDDLKVSNVIMILLETEALLCFNKGLMLHGCTVETEKGGLLFTGPSGIGKSTQGSLWETYADACVLNGDRAGIMRENGTWKSWGLPFAGSSAIYINRGTALKGIVVLDQAKENRLVRLSMKEAFSALYPQTHLHKWSPSFMEKGTENLIDLILSVPVYRLSCRPDEEAVRIVQKEIFGGDWYVSPESDI